MRIFLLMFLNKKWMHNFSQRLMMSTPTDPPIVMPNTIHHNHNIGIHHTNKNKNSNSKNKNKNQNKNKSTHITKKSL